MLYEYKIWMKNKTIDEWRTTQLMHWSELSVFDGKIISEPKTEIAELKTPSEEVKTRRWMIIGYILTQDGNCSNDMETWKDEDLRQEERRDGGWRSWAEVRVVVQSEVEKFCEGVCATSTWISVHMIVRIV